MANLTSRTKRLIEEVISSRYGAGYVLDFSDRTMRDFFADFDVEIYDKKYQTEGSSKAKCIRGFLQVEPIEKIVPVLRALWECRQEIEYYRQLDLESKLTERYLPAIAELEGAAVANTAGIDRFAKTETLEEIVGAIERDIAAGKPVAALDRLHTYCQIRFAHLLVKHKIMVTRDEPLHSRVGKYAGHLKKTRDAHDMTWQIVRNAFGIFEKFNDVRNNKSFAHDNEVIDSSQARFIFDSVAAFLRFVKRIENE